MYNDAAPESRESDEQLPDRMPEFKYSQGLRVPCERVATNPDQPVVLLAGIGYEFVTFVRTPEKKVDVGYKVVGSKRDDDYKEQSDLPRDSENVWPNRTTRLANRASSDLELPVTSTGPPKFPPPGPKGSSEFPPSGPDHGPLGMPQFDPNNEPTHRVGGSKAFSTLPGEYHHGPLYRSFTRVSVVRIRRFLVWWHVVRWPYSDRHCIK